MDGASWNFANEQMELRTRLRTAFLSAQSVFRAAAALMAKQLDFADERRR